MGICHSEAGRKEVRTVRAASITTPPCLTKKLRDLYKNKKSSTQISNMESWVNLRLREKYEWDKVEQNRADKKKNSAGDDDGEEWAVDAEDDDDY